MRRTQATVIAERLAGRSSLEFAAAASAIRPGRWADQARIRIGHGLCEASLAGATTWCLSALALCGCVPSSQEVGPSLDQVIQNRNSIAAAARPDAPSTSSPGDPVIARVNGREISRSAVADLLMRSHGVGVLEQLIGLETAQRLAESKGVSIGQQDIEREYELALRRLVDPLAPITSPAFDRKAAEALLVNVLAERNISREEFFVILRRNAYLRKIVQQEQTFSEEQLRAEYSRAYGRRVQVRHIQLGSPGDVARVQERLAAGEDFSDLATRYSANAASAKRGGLLEPFSMADDELPEAFRQVGFSLRPGEVSGPVRVGSWEHLLKLETAIEPEERDFTAVRGELEERLRERTTDEQMRRLHERLFREAAVEIEDTALRDAFFQRYPDLQSIRR